MKRIALVLACIAAVAGTSVAVAGEGHDHSHGKGHDHAHGTADTAKLKEVSVEELAKLIEGGSVKIFDANRDETRTKFGIVPGATLLASSSAYDTSVLPADKTQMLVFYCANTRCTASDSAAARAKAAGWPNVAVLRAGIAGWVDAGKVVAKPEAAASKS